MQRYSIISDKKFHSIKETKTGYIIKKCTSKNEAIKTLKGLNKGTGFNGESPRFFVYAKDQ